MFYATYLAHTGLMHCLVYFQAQWPGRGELVQFVLKQKRTLSTEL